MAITQKIVLGISSNFLYSIRTSIYISENVIKIGVILEPIFGKNHGIDF